MTTDAGSVTIEDASAWPVFADMGIHELVSRAVTVRRRPDQPVADAAKRALSVLTADSLVGRLLIEQPVRLWGRTHPGKLNSRTAVLLAERRGLWGGVADERLPLGQRWERSIGEIGSVVGYIQVDSPQIYAAAEWARTNLAICVIGQRDSDLEEFASRLSKCKDDRSILRLAVSVVSDTVGVLRLWGKFDDVEVGAELLISKGRR